MITEIIVSIFLFAGLAVCVCSTVGMLRLPDFYTRSHASGNSETLGLLLPCIGFMIASGISFMTLKIVILFLIVFLNNPIGSHALGRAALYSGHHVWKKDKNKENK